MNNKKKYHFDFNKLLASAALVLLYVFFCFRGSNFFSAESMINILESSYFIGFLAIGVTFSIISGGIDLSIGAVMISSALIGGVAYSTFGVSIWIALFICVLTGTLFGLLSGLLVGITKIVPFVATLGIQMFASGSGSIISKVTTQRYPSAGTEDGIFKMVFFKVKNIPVGVFWLAAFFALAWVLLNYTRLGRYTYAIGSNEEAARLSGVNVDFWKVIIYCVVGFYSGMAGIMYASAYTSIVPGNGPGMEILGIAAVIIGGTSVSGGSGTLSGTLIGVYIMAVLKQGLMSMGLQGHYQTFFTGIVLIAAVLLDNYRTKKTSSVKKEAA